MRAVSRLSARHCSAARALNQPRSCEPWFAQAPSLAQSTFPVPSIAQRENRTVQARELHPPWGGGWWRRDARGGDGTLRSARTPQPAGWEQRLRRSRRKDITQVKENGDIFPLLIVCCLASYRLPFLQSCYLFSFAIYWILEAFNQL